MLRVGKKPWLPQLEYCAGVMGGKEGTDLIAIVQKTRQVVYDFHISILGSM